MKKIISALISVVLVITSIMPVIPVSAEQENTKYLLNLNFDSLDEASGVIGLKAEKAWIAPGESQLSYVQDDYEYLLRFPLSEAMDLEGTDKYEIKLRFKMPYDNYRLLGMSNGNPSNTVLYPAMASGFLALCRYSFPNTSESDLSLDDKTGIGSASSDEWRTATITYDNGNITLEVVDEKATGNVTSTTSTTLAALTGSGSFQHRPGTTYDHLLLGHLSKGQKLSLDYIQVTKTAAAEVPQEDDNSLLNLNFDSLDDASKVIGLKPEYAWIAPGESQLSYVQDDTEYLLRFPLSEAMDLEGTDKYEIKLRFKMPYDNYRLLGMSNGNPSNTVLYPAMASGFLALCRYSFPNTNESDMSLDDKTGIGSASSDEWRTATITYDNGNITLEVVDEKATGNVTSTTSTTLEALTGSGSFQHRPGTTYDHLLLGHLSKGQKLSLDYIKVTKTSTPRVTAVTALAGEVEQQQITGDTTAVKLQFNHEMDEESLLKAVTVYDESGKTAGWNGVLSSDKKVFILNLKEPLSTGMSYKLSVGTEAKTSEGEFLRKEFVSWFFCEDSYTLLAANYDIKKPDIELIQGANASVEIKEEINGNKYMSIQPNWGNSGYSLAYTIPNSDRDYKVRFDFSLEGVRKDIASIMLCEKASVKQGGESVYNQFGLIRPTEEGGFSVAGNDVSGIKYEENKWYSYEMNFNREKQELYGKICERDDPAVSANFRFVAQHGIYGNGMPDLKYDALKFGCNGTVNIDNIVLCETIDKPVKSKVTSGHTGNIFDGQDIKTLQIQLENILHTAIDVSLGYTITDEDGHVLKSESGIPITMNAAENKTYPVSVEINKFGTYKLMVDLQVTGDEVWTYQCGAFPFSVVNKRKDGEALNYEIGGNISSYYIETQDKWNNVKEIMMQAGIGGMRTVLHWNDVQKTEGVFNNNDAAYANIAYPDAVGNGIHNLATISMENAVLYGGWDKPNAPHEIGTETAWAEWEAYIDYVSKTYKDSVTYWEIINEPNAFITGTEYAEYLKRAYPIIKKNDPDGLVCGFALSGREWDWIEDALKIVGSNYMDVITVHPYDWEFGENSFYGLEHWSTVFRDNKYVNDIKNLKALCQKYGCGDMPIISTEVSVSSTPPTTEHKGLASLNAQAAELTQLYALTKKEGIIDSSHWYSLICTSVRGFEDVVDGDRNGNFGVIGNEKDAVPYAAKPAYVAMAGYNKMLTNAEYIDGIENINGAEGTRAYRFSKPDGQQVIVLWAENKAENIALDLGIDNVELYDKYTNKIGVLRADDGVYNLTATFEPIYILGDIQTFERSIGTISVDVGRQESLCGDITEFNFTDAKNRNLRIEAYGTKWAEVVEDTDIENGTGNLKVRLKSGARQEEPIDVSIYDGKNLLYYGRLHIIAGEASIGMLTIDQKEIRTIYDAEDGELTIPVLMNNLYNYESGANVYIAFYDSTGRLLSIQEEAAGNLTRGRNWIKSQIAVPDACGSMKVYLWAGNEGMIPICDTLCIQ